MPLVNMLIGEGNFRLAHGTLVAKGGFTQIANGLLRNRKKLKLTRSELELAEVLMSYEYGGATSKPSLREIAKQSGATETTVHRARAGLENKGYLQVNRSKKDPKYGTYSYDLTGLRKRLREFAQCDLENDLINRKITEAEYRELKKIDDMEDVLFRPPP